MGAMKVVKAVAAVATVASAVLVAPQAQAGGPYAIDAHVDGVAGGGNYSPGSFHWTDQNEITFTHATDSSTGSLQGLAQTHAEVPTAVVHETLNGTQVVTLAMSGVHVEAIHSEGSVNDSNGPQETVVLRFRQLVFTFQPVLPNGQKNGPPVTVTWKH